MAEQMAAKTSTSRPACSFLRRSRIRLAVCEIGSEDLVGGV